MDVQFKRVSLSIDLEADTPAGFLWECVKGAAFAVALFWVTLAMWTAAGAGRVFARALVVLGEVLWAMRAKRASCAVVDVAARIRRRVG